MRFRTCAPSSHVPGGPSWGPPVSLAGGIITAGGTESGDDPSFATLQGINILVSMYLMPAIGQLGPF